MKYYIVVNEWNYPTESGRDFVGDYDTREEAEAEVTIQGDKELENFQEVTGDLYSEASGLFHDAHLNIWGYALHSSQYESEDFYFVSRIIEVKSLFS